jgi:AAA+ superfamily predicted ATPase
LLLASALRFALSSFAGTLVVGMTDHERLVRLLQSGTTCVSICTCEEDEALGLCRDAALELAIPMQLWTASVGLRDALLEDSARLADTESPAAALALLLDRKPAPFTVLVDIAAHLKDAKILRMLRDLIAAYAKSGTCTLLLIDHSLEWPECIRAAASGFELSLPDEQQLGEILRSTLRSLNEQHPVQVSLNAREVAMVIRNLSGLTARETRRIIHGTVAEDWRLDARDINKVLAEKRRRLQGMGLLEFVEAPVDLGEIGGLNNLKRWLKLRQSALSPEAAQFGLPHPRGILMLGVQGAGKSLSAKAVATAWQRPLMRMDPSVLFDRYVGESERRLHDALRQAEMMAPIILWIDEIEKGFASAASQSTDGGLSQRMFGTLLTWMQEHKAAVFTIATANNIEALPPELLRKGRFDEIFFVDLPGLEARASIFQIHLKIRNRDPGRFDLAALAAAADGYSGAEIEQAIIAGLYEAFPDRAELTTARLIDALRRSPPLSVTMADRVAELRAWAEGRCVPAEGPPEPGSDADAGKATPPAGGEVSVGLRDSPEWR